MVLSFSLLTSQKTFTASSEGITNDYSRNSENHAFYRQRP